MWKYCKRYQEIADAVAKELHHYAAYYVGKYEEQGVFGFIDEDSAIRCTGCYTYYLLIDKEGNTQEISVDVREYEKSILHKVNRSKRNEGKKIYNKLLGKLERRNYTMDEKKYLQYLSALDLNNIDDDTYALLPKQTIFLWLEAAYRYKDEIAIFRTSIEYSDGWEYEYIVAIKDIFLQRIKDWESSPYSGYMCKWEMLEEYQLLNLRNSNRFV